MAFTRKTKFLEPLPDDDTLTSRMRGIGMSFVGADKTDWDANFELTLIHASMIGLDGNDYRVLRALVAWLEVHAARVNVDRLCLTLEQCDSSMVTCFWSSLSARLLKADPRFRRVAAMYDGPTLSPLGETTEFQVSRHGLDPRFDEAFMQVPANFLPARSGDVYPPEFMMVRSRVYFWRTLIGPTWRADAWAFLEASPEASAAVTARQLGCSYGAAWKYVQDFRQCREAMKQGSKERNVCALTAI